MAFKISLCHIFTLVVLPLDILLYAEAFKLYNPFYTHHTLFYKRSSPPTRQQCVLVVPSPGFNLPAAQEGGGDQSPLLPSPSMGEPGMIRAQSACGDIGATGSCILYMEISTIQVFSLSQESISPLSGPNGAISWITCGINSTGWTPSYATVSDIVTADLASALQQDNSPFQACNRYLDIIEKYAAQFEGIV